MNKHDSGFGVIVDPRAIFGRNLHFSTLEKLRDVNPPIDYCMSVLHGVIPTYRMTPRE
jgi:hypothetical protein